MLRRDPRTPRESKREGNLHAMEAGAAESETIGLVGAGVKALRRCRLPGPFSIRRSSEPRAVYASVVPPPLAGRMRQWLRSALGLDPVRDLDVDVDLDDLYVVYSPLQKAPVITRMHLLLRDPRSQERMERETATKCLEHYNAMNPGSEFELAAGDVTRYKAAGPRSLPGFWTHGNFLARRRRTGCFSFIPGARTLFFFEIGINGVVTCVPLYDETVDEPYGFLGFQLGCGKRRSGKFDRVCQTCACRLVHSNPFPLECGHQEVERICNMCYHRCHVIHPLPGKFQCGHQKDIKFTYFGGVWT